MYISNTGHRGTFKLASIKLLNGCFQIGVCLILNESRNGHQLVIVFSYESVELVLPSTIALASGFGIHDVQSRATGEIFEVLFNH